MEESRMEELFAIEELASTAPPQTTNSQIPQNSQILSQSSQQQQTENNHKLINHLIEIHSKAPKLKMACQRLYIAKCTC